MLCRAKLKLAGAPEGSGVSVAHLESFVPEAAQQLPLSAVVFLFQPWCCPRWPARDAECCPLGSAAQLQRPHPLVALLLVWTTWQSKALLKRVAAG